MLVSCIICETYLYDSVNGIMPKTKQNSKFQLDSTLFSNHQGMMITKMKKREKNK